MSSRVIVALAALAGLAAACGPAATGRGGAAAPVGAAAGTLGNRAAPSAGPLGAALQRDLGGGGSVAIVPGRAGLRAISSDGARVRVLVPGPVAWALLDRRAGVVWFARQDPTVILAVDLDQPDPGGAAGPAIVTVVTGLPDAGQVAMVGPPIFGVVYPVDDPTISPGEAFFSGDHFATGPVMNLAAAHVDLVIQRAPELSASSGYVQDADFDAAVPRATIVGKDFVVGLLARPDHRAPGAGPAVPREAHVDGVDPKGCDDPADCGRAEVIAGTRYWRVLVGDVMGDIRHLAWRLYDADARQFVAAPWAESFQDARVAPDHTAFLAGGVIIRFATGPVAATPADGAGLGGDWLGGGDVYDM